MIDLQNLLNYINVPNITLVFSVLTPMILLFIKYDLDRKINKEEYRIKEIFELNGKMHDRLVEAQEVIKANNYITGDIKRRLLYNSSRLKRYDKTIWDDTNLLINNWNDVIFQKVRGNINDGQVSKERVKSIDLIDKIKSKIDKL